MSKFYANCALVANAVENVVVLGMHKIWPRFSQIWKLC